jgi:hypothetical protein
MDIETMLETATLPFPERCSPETLYSVEGMLHRIDEIRQNMLRSDCKHCVDRMAIELGGVVHNISWLLHCGPTASNIFYRDILADKS